MSDTKVTVPVKNEDPFKKINNVKKQMENISETITDRVTTPLYRIKHNWDGSTSGKIGTVAGVATIGIAGGIAGFAVGTSAYGATIGTILFPGFGTFLGGAVGLATGILVGTIPGALVGSEMGHKLTVPKDISEVFDHGLVVSETVVSVVSATDKKKSGDVKEDIKTENVTPKPEITPTEIKPVTFTENKPEEPIKEDLFDVKLESVLPGQSKLNLVAAIRKVNPDISLKTAKICVDTAPALLVQGVSKTVAENWVSQLEKFAIVSIVEK